MNTREKEQMAINICKVQKISLEWLLSNVDFAADSGKKSVYMVDAHIETVQLITKNNSLNNGQRDRIQRYIDAFYILLK